MQETINNLNTENQKKGNQVSNNIVIENQNKSNINSSNNLDTQKYYDSNDDDEDDEEAVDMDSFLESGLLEDDSVIFFYT